MPCKDTTSRIEVVLDHDERLVDFDFNKITCGKEIGGETGLKDFCRGHSLDEIEAFDVARLVEDLQPNEGETQFFLYLEWDALLTSIAQYRGRTGEIDLERYQLAAISYDEESIRISQVIHPNRNMPKIIPCGVKDRLEEESQSG
ncbi:MAG: hypothetical protein COV67_02265 [Nitrospinae bacterium CG11_big_fil_rev_8_21_14_0_20_56_8]|nr:MAG: hypothetical protein COV67_02265 [Nitrospinae bacterium CG11_big_fil_rev_8_21_14_0_20_56_8]